MFRWPWSKKKEESIISLYYKYVESEVWQKLGDDILRRADVLRLERDLTHYEKATVEAIRESYGYKAHVGYMGIWYTRE